MAADDVSAVVGANVRRLRSERGWSQQEMARRAREQGLRKWSPGAVGLIETGGQRADRLLDLVALCRLFSCTMDELLQDVDDIDSVNVAAPEPVSLSQLRMVLRGILPVVDEAGTYAEGEDPYQLAKIARKLNLDVEQFQLAVRAVFGTGTFFELRDERAGVSVRPGTAREIQARRAAATKAMLSKIRLQIELNDGIDGLIELALQDLRDMDALGEIDVREDDAQSGGGPTS